ncbi:MAG: hypothetical protein WD070_01415 [Pirellulaceae bacterium]
MSGTLPIRFAKGVAKLKNGSNEMTALYVSPGDQMQFEAEKGAEKVTDTKSGDDG